jgi:putative transposase
MWTAKAREPCKDDGRRCPSDLTDAEWQTIELVLCSYATLTVDLREMVNACLYLEKAGCGLPPAGWRVV